MALNDLPVELLTRIYQFLDWDPVNTIHHSLHRADIINISLTSRNLREAVLPVLFQNVRLLLQWNDGLLIEPKLYRLRRDCPQLVRYVRCVEIDVRFDGPYYTSTAEAEPSIFSIPTDISDWITSGSATTIENHQQELYADVRMRADTTGRQLLKVCGYHQLFKHSEDLSAEEIIRSVIDMQNASQSDSSEESSTNAEESQDETTELEQDRRVLTMKRLRRRVNHQYLEALAVVMLCIPASVDTLVIRTLPEKVRHGQQARFTTQIAKAAMSIFNNRIRNLTAVMNHGLLAPPPHARSLTTMLERLREEEKSETDRILSGMSAVKRLTLVSSDGKDFFGDVAMITLEKFALWHHLSNTVVHLHLRYVRLASFELISAIKGFLPLVSLEMDHVALFDAPARRRHRCRELEWLHVLMEMRQSMPLTDIQLGALELTHPRMRLLDSSVKWIARAIPVGSAVDLERKERLSEDFVSFLPLWEAEKDNRGLHAQAEWDKSGGMLVDQAMTNRWR